MPLLDYADPFPTLEIPAVGGGTIRLPRDLEDTFGVILINRGSWCPICTAQLASFQRAQDNLAQAGARTVAFSVDNEASAADLVEREGLRFPVGHSADAYSVAAATGAFVNPDSVYLQSTGFLLDPRGRVLVSVYSSGAIGRLAAPDVIGMITHIREQAA
jgi:peroxiredoxin